MRYIEKYFPGLSVQQREQFKMILALYPDWNKSVNVISRKDIDNLELHHVLHSLAIAKVISFKAGTRILDVGTGGGFPGIPLAIMFPSVQFVLMDSIRKKIKVVDDIVKTVGLKNVGTKWSRAEDMKGSFDFIVSRAVSRLDVFYEWVHHLISDDNFNILDNGILYLKGGEIEKELESTKLTHSFYPLAPFFPEPFFEEKGLVYIKHNNQAF